VSDNDTLIAIIERDVRRMEALAIVQRLALPDCWIAAGFVRDAVWDYLHGRHVSPPFGDVDVVWFDRRDLAPTIDRAIEAQLREFDATLDWSVKNQARMHGRNGDKPYRSVGEAMTAWPETATAIAIRMGRRGELEINAPLGLDDLFGLRLTPTLAFCDRKRAIFDERVRSKRWLERYPLLRLSGP
jgi:uncharacterized protein